MVCESRYECIWFSDFSQKEREETQQLTLQFVPRQNNVTVGPIRSKV